MYTKSRVFPDKFRTALTCSDVYNIAVGTGAAATFFRVGHFHLNSAFEPRQIPGSTQQGLWYDQMKLLYRRTTTFAAKIQFTFLASSVTKALKVTTSTHLESVSGIPTDKEATADPNTTLTIFFPAGLEAQNKVSITKFVNMRTFFGVPIDDGYQEIGTTKIAPPDKICAFSVWVRHLDGSDMDDETVSIRMQLTQYMQFTDRIKPVES